MRLIIQNDYEAVSKWAAEHVIEKINAFNPTPEKPFVLGLPTGSSPIGMYRNLVKAYEEAQKALLPPTPPKPKMIKAILSFYDEAMIDKIKKFAEENNLGLEVK